MSSRCFPYLMHRVQKYQEWGGGRGVWGYNVQAMRKSKVSSSTNRWIPTSLILFLSTSEEISGKISDTSAVNPLLR